MKKAAQGLLPRAVFTEPLGLCVCVSSQGALFQGKVLQLGSRNGCEGWV